MGSVISPPKPPPASRLRNASMTHRPDRSRIRRPLYSSSPVSGAARPMSNGPVTEPPGADQTPPRSPAARRRASTSPVRQENISIGRPATTSTCCTSRCQKPASGRLSGGCACHRTRSRERACPTTPGCPSALWAALAVTSMCQPSPPGSGYTHGSRQASSGWSGPSCAYQRGSLSSTGEAGCLRQVYRSADVARPMRCLRPCSVWVQPV